MLGTAVGDALGLAVEGLSAKRLRRLFGRVEGYRLLGRTGYISDDTEHTAFVAAALAEAPDDPDRCARRFARRLRGWVLRLPFGVGFATLRACAKLLLLVPPSRSGVRSAGNGAAMRAAFSDALARVTHTDPRAVEGARLVAALAAQAAPDLRTAAQEITEPSLREAIGRAQTLVAAGASTEEAARALGVSGFVLHTVPFAAFCAARHGDDPRRALVEAVNAGGDADTIGAIVGALVGARHGRSCLPADLVAALEDGPLGRSHLEALAHALATGERPPGYSAILLLLRNTLLVPVVLAHAGWRAIGPLFVRRG